MSNLTINSHLPQLRCKPVRNALPPEPLRYERRISNRWVPCNHKRAKAIVGVIKRRWGAL